MNMIFSASKRFRPRASPALTALLLCVGCAGSVPRELADARSTYQRAASGPASQDAPAQLHVAQQALGIAEKTYDDEGDSDKARDRAYVATRKAELAEAQARIADLDRQSLQSKQRAQLAQAQSAAKTKAQLGNATAQLEVQQQQLEGERKLGVEAQQQSRDALAALERVAAVKKDARGTIITLPGGVLFTTGKADLLPSARAKLSEVASALAKDSNATLVVEGHTDSRGAATMNQELSENRARAVRDFLVSKGVAADHITSEGFGLTRPVASNDTAEGRADNRRVEIVVHSGDTPAVGGGQPSSHP